MFTQSFALRKNPFSMTPDPAFLFLTPQHREALVGLTYGILQRKGFVVLTGDAGTGKTTLLSRVLQFLPESKLQFSVVLNPTLTPSEFLESALLDFGVAQVPASKAQRLRTFQKLLFDGQSNGKVSALIIDEAHTLSPDVLEEIRLLGNFEEADQKLLQIVLVGQNELDTHLERQDLRQLKQRIALRLAIKPLEPTEVGQYVRHRWLVAGGNEPPFSTAAIALIASASGGIPRVINSLCDNALTLTLAEGKLAVSARHIQLAAGDLRLGDLRTECNEPASMAIDPPPVPDGPTLKPYNGSPSRLSSWTRWTGKLGFLTRNNAT